ncbi:MAG: NAD-dependent epimerase/dehydratase family protein, partial [Gemmatimonadota bacterium]
MTRVLVTGATGFVGSRIAAAYAATDCELRCTVRASSDTRWFEDTRAELVQADVT